ncbi:right-handed parallel beta-helix repeat-containing protein [Rhizobium sp. Leaf262]|uniref:right-handed parallel beta-helix repeat-containing protein n=1 Tax=Rhizobium sp. Leaf262 TaxID=1736312 RepID=UPI00071301B1|nr:right-handed parallel beta-helix repeat-containing protein [Rhizobium sp. Leaf262]KQO76271.1 hypothetical protein ASF29_09830 [Rhizobium sp. Leaf262]
MEATAAFPDDSNTGVKAGAVLQKYRGTLHIKTPNAVVSNMEITGDIVIDAPNVTVSNTRLISDTPWHALRVMDAARGFTLVDSEIDGRGLTDNAVYGFGTFLRNNLHDAENGMTIWGPSRVQGNYIHCLRSTNTDPHYDGVQMTGGTNVEISGNTIINGHSQTSAVGIGNTFGILSDITITNNRLLGGGYTVQVDGRKGGGALDSASIRITGNQIGGGRWGDFAIWDSKPIVSGNINKGTDGIEEVPSCRRP